MNGTESWIATRESLKTITDTIDGYLKHYISDRAATLDEGKALGDMAEYIIVEAIKGGDLETCRWYAQHKLTDRGYV